MHGFLELIFYNRALFKVCPNSIEHNKSGVNVSGFGMCTDFKENPFLLKNR